jgi:hypothetical protein
MFTITLGDLKVCETGVPYLNIARITPDKKKIKINIKNSPHDNLGPLINI